MPNIIAILISRKSQIQLCFIAAIFLSFFFTGHAVESLTIIGFVVFSLMLLFNNQKIKSNYFQLSFFAIYFVMLCSFLWAENTYLFLQKIILKSTLTALPFCFLFIDKFEFKMIVSFSTFLLILIACSLIYVGINFYIHYDEILLSLRAGSAIPVPFRSHIRYSILLNFCLLIFIYLSHEFYKIKDTKNMFFWLICSVFILISILILAVKTGIFILILCMLFFISYLVYKYKVYFIGVAILFFGILTIYFLVQNVPTLRNKFDYFVYDLSQMSTSEDIKYSDASRIISIKKGIEIIKKSPWIGVGEGNVSLYLKSTDTENVKLPHNQFVIAWAQNGILGFILFVAVFIFGFYYSWQARNWIFICYNFAMIFACSIEPMLETQLGVAMFTLPLLFLYSIKPKEQ